jgi:GGDEF domain-containing protein
LQKKEKEEKKYEKIINQGFSGKNDEINNKNIPKIVYENGINIEEKRRSGIPKEPVDIRILKYEKKFFSKYENITDDQLKKRRRELLSSENIEKNSRFYNPVIFEEIFEIEVITSIRKRYNLSFGMFELSGLKKIIEKLPEDQKKPMIRDIYEMIKSFIRDELDIPILLSSDCYAVIFNQTDIKNALEIIDVYLNTVKSISIDNEKLNLLYGITELNEKALSPKIMYEQVVKKLKIS